MAWIRALDSTGLARTFGLARIRLGTVIPASRKEQISYGTNKSCRSHQPEGIWQIGRVTEEEELAKAMASVTLRKRKSI